MRTGALPALRHGVGGVGANPTMLKAAWSFACAVRGERGRKSFARLALAKYDPGIQLATYPLVDWAKAACRAALPELSGGAQPFARVRGPASATVALALC